MRLVIGLHAYLVAAIPAVAVVVCLRTLSLVIYAWTTGRAGLPLAVGLTLGYAALFAAAVWAGQAPPLRWFVVGLVYYTFVACAVYWVQHLRRSASLDTRAATRPVAFAAIALVALFLPSALWPFSAAATFLALGFDVLLKGYSFCTDTERSDQLISVPDFLFFMLVDPSLVYAERARRAPHDRSERPLEHRTV